MRREFDRCMAKLCLIIDLRLQIDILDVPDVPALMLIGQHKAWADSTWHVAGSTATPT